MYGIRHLINCRCILPQFKNINNPTFHKFIVFSVVDEDDQVIQSHAQCNNCGIIHKVVDICKSEIVKGKEQLASIPNLSDIKLELPDSLVDLLTSYNADITVWQHAQFIIRHQKWGTKIIIQREEEEEEVSGKILIFVGPRQFRMESFQESR